MTSGSSICSVISLSTKILTQDADMRKLYLYGKDSIVRNLPYLSLQSFNNYSYMSIRQYISHFVAGGKRTPDINMTQPNVHRIITNFMLITPRGTPQGKYPIGVITNN